MKKLVLGMATVFMLMLGSVSPVLAYEYDGVDTSEMTQEELWAAQEKHLQERMEASEDMQKLPTSKRRLLHKRKRKL